MGGLWLNDTSVWGTGDRLREDDKGTQDKPATLEVHHCDCSWMKLKDINYIVDGGFVPL